MDGLWTPYTPCGGANQLRIINHYSRRTAHDIASRWLWRASTALPNAHIGRGRAAAPPPPTPSPTTPPTTPLHPPPATGRDCTAWPPPLLPTRRRKVWLTGWRGLLPLPRATATTYLPPPTYSRGHGIKWDS